MTLTALADLIREKNGELGCDRTCRPFFMKHLMLCFLIQQALHGISCHQGSNVQDREIQFYVYNYNSILMPTG